MSYLSQLIQSNSWMGNLPSSVHHWERIKLVLNLQLQNFQSNTCSAAASPNKHCKVYNLCSKPPSVVTAMLRSVYSREKDSCGIPHQAFSFYVIHHCWNCTVILQSKGCLRIRVYLHFRHNSYFCVNNH